MEAWRAQDTSPLEDKTLLQVALRKEQAKLQKQRRMERWLIYPLSIFLVVAMGLILGMMIYPSHDDVVIVWDYAAPAVGVAASFVMAGALYAIHRAQAARDQSFGDSLRDQLHRRIAQLDDAATKERRTVRVLVVAGLLYALALSIAGQRINDVPYGEFHWPVLPALICLFVFFVAFGSARRSMQRRILLRKGALEALLKELDSQ
jgi:peptidoglycan/LPS O-acetylase OafA/YrhL